jgi:DNA-binding IclR family transcriptional regulator
MVQVVNRAFDIIELVSLREGQPISLTEIADALDLKQSTTANIIKTLVNRKYIEHIGAKKGYRIGTKINELAQNNSQVKVMIECSKEIMEQLTQHLEESCILGVIKNYKRYAIHAAYSSQELQVNVQKERNIYETASGRLLMAFLSTGEVDRIIKANSMPNEDIWSEATCRESLLKELKKIRKNEIAITHLKNRYVKGFAVPVFDRENVVASLSVFLPEVRCTPEKQMQIKLELKSASELISLNMNNHRNF